MKFNKHYATWAVLTAAYTLLSSIIPPESSTLTRYAISAEQARLLSLSVALPYVAIWLAAFYGYITCKRYAIMIKNNKDGRAMGVVAQGLMYLAISLPAAAIVNALVNYFAMRHPSLKPSLTIFYNYFSLLLVLVAFYTINTGTSMLVKTLVKPKVSRAQLLLIGVFVLFCAFYTFVTLTNPARQFPITGLNRAAYYLPDIPLTITIIIPYVLVWYLGFSATHKIFLYRQNVKGVIYQQALKRLAWGLGSVVISSMIIRFLSSLTTQLNNLNLRYLLVILYLLLLTIAFGYLLIASGAKKMKRIEEV